MPFFPLVCVISFVFHIALKNDAHRLFSDFVALFSFFVLAVSFQFRSGFFLVSKLNTMHSQFLAMESF